MCNGYILRFVASFYKIFTNCIFKSTIYTHYYFYFLFINYLITDLPVKLMNDPAQDALEVLEYLKLPEKN